MLERTLLLSLVVAAGATAATWPVRWASAAAGSAWSATNLPVTLATAVLGFVLTAAVLVVAHAVRVPSLLRLARRADRVLGQQQRLSTALEVLERNGAQPASIVERLLLEDVQRRVPTLDLGRVVRRPIPPQLWITLGALTVTAGLAVALPVPTAATPIEATSPAAPSTAADVTPDSVEQTIALAESIADSLASEPIIERDPFLRAVADGFSDLALQLQEGRIDVAEADQMVEDLLSYLDDAVDRSGGSLQDAVREAMPEGIDRGRGEDSNATIPSFGSQATDAEEGREPAPVTDRSPPDATPGSDGRSALERLAEALERRAEERAAAAAAGDTEAFGGDESNPYGQEVNVVRESQGGGEPGMDPLLRADAEGAGRAAGAAQQSSDAAGDAAGGGSAELQGAAADFERDDAQIDLAPLDASEQDEGSSVEASFAPTEGEAGARQVTADPPDRAFDRAHESGTPSHTLGWAHRDVVRRYFLPEAAVAAEPSP